MTGAQAAHQSESKAGFYFEPESRLQLVDKLRHFARFSDFLLVLTGEPGVGKSTLLNQIEPLTQDDSIRSCYIRASAELGISELLKKLLAQLPDHSNYADNDQGRLSALNEQIRQARAQGQRLFVVVDDADRLPGDVLDLLINLQFSGENEDGTAPRLLLAGEPDLIDNLQSGGWADSLAGRLHYLELEPFTPAEMHSYLQVKVPDSRAFSEKGRARLIEQAEGFPGRIDRLLQEMPQREVAKGHSAFPLPPLHMAGVLVLLVAITVIAAWQFSPDEGPVVTVDKGVERIAVPLSLDKPGQAVVAEVPVNTELQKRLAEKEALLSRAAPVISPPVPVLAVQAPVATGAQAGQSDTPILVIPSDSQGAVPVTVAVQSEPEAVKNTPVVVVAAPEVKKPVITEKSRTPKVKSAPEATVKPPVVVISVPGTTRLEQDEMLLLGLSADDYTLQVLGARELRSVERFMKRQGADSALRAFSTIFKGKPWYVVVYGQYATKRKAMAAVRSLPQALRKQRPWARSLKGIHNDIRKK
ncbi:MAG: SPOR domain-containing protein [Pontibacterium sp.]